MAKRPRTVTDEEVLSRASHLIASAVLGAWATGSMSPEEFREFQEDSRRGLSAISRILAAMEPQPTPVAEPECLCEHTEPPEGRAVGVPPGEESELYAPVMPVMEPTPVATEEVSASDKAEEMLQELLAKYNLT